LKIRRNIAPDLPAERSKEWIDSGQFLKKSSCTYTAIRARWVDLLLPALLLLLLGYGVSGESKNISMAVVDLSRTEESARYVEYYTAGDDFSYDYSAANEVELLDLIHRDKVKVGLLIPEGYGRSVATGDPVQVQLYVNGSADPSIVRTIQLKLQANSQIARKKFW
jgi:hypothetical protein